MTSNRVVMLQVDAFKVHGSTKAQSKKVLEEAAEVYNEAEMARKHPDLDYNLVWLEDEVADVITAAVNLVWLARRKEDGGFGIDDLEDTMAHAMERCRHRNEAKCRL